MQSYNIAPTISARDIQRGYKRVFDSVKKTKRPVVVMAKNAPQAAIISLEMLEDYNKLRSDQELFAIIDEIQAKNRNKDPDEVWEDVTQSVEEVRREMYEQEKAKGGR